MACESDIATEYEDSSSLQKEHGLAFISELSIKRRSKVLDLGCGTGFLSKKLAGIVGPEGCVVALDNDTQRLRVASCLNCAHNLEYTEGSGEDPFPGKEYDLVFSNYVLHWINRKDLVFQNVYKSLKVGGQFSFLTVAPYDVAGTYFTPSSMVSHEVQSRLVLKQLCFIEDTELKQLASENNFDVVSFVKEEKQMKFENIDTIIEFLRVSLYRGKGFDDTHFNKFEMLSHFGESSIVTSYPIYKIIFVKYNYYDLLE